MTFRMVPDALIEAPWCGPFELATYTAIRKLAAPGDTVRAGIDDIAAIFGISHRAVRYSLAELAGAGWVAVERRNGSHTRYTCRDRPMVGIVEQAETPADLSRTVEVVSAADRAKVAAIVDDLATQMGTERRPGLSTTAAPGAGVLARGAAPDAATAAPDAATAAPDAALSPPETKRDKKEQQQEAASG